MANIPFPWRRTFVLGFGFFGISIVWPIFNSLIPPMLDKLGLASLVVGFIMTWDNIINMFFQPWIGARSDRTRSRWGRRKPWLIAGAPLAALFFILIPFVRDNFVLIAVGILLTNIGMALFRTPTVAYLGDLFTPHETSRANGVINLMGGLGGAIALFGGGALYKIGVPLPFIFGAAVMLVAIVVVLAFVREPETPATASKESGGLIANLREVATGRDKSALLLLGAIFTWFMAWNAIEAFFTLYVDKQLGISVGTGTQMLTVFAAMLIVFAIPSGLIATRIGRKPTILIGLGGMMAGLALAFLLGSSALFQTQEGVWTLFPDSTMTFTFTLQRSTLLLVLLAAMGAFWACVNINSLPLVYDLGGGKDVGALTGLYYFSSSAAAIAGPITAGGLIDLAGGNYSVIWLFAAVFMALAIVCMSMVRPKPVTSEASAFGALETS